MSMCIKRKGAGARKRCNRLAARAVWSTRSRIIYVDVRGPEVKPGMLNSEVLKYSHRTGSVKWLGKAGLTLDEEGTLASASTGIYFLEVIKPGQIGKLVFLSESFLSTPCSSQGDRQSPGQQPCDTWKPEVLRALTQAGDSRQASQSSRKPTGPQEPPSPPEEGALL